MRLISISSKFALHLQPKKGKETQTYLHIRPKLVNSRLHLRLFCFCSLMTSVKIGTGLTCDSQYFKIYTGCFIICVTIKNCYGFFEYAKIYKRLTQPRSRHSKVLFNLFINKFLSTYIHIRVHIHMRQGLGLGYAYLCLIPSVLQ